MRKGKLIGLAMVGVLVVGGITACGSTSGVSTGDGNQSKQEAPAAKNTVKKSFNVTSSVNGLEVTIGEIQVKNTEIKVGLTVKNTAAKAISFYPDQGSAVIGSVQLEANMFMNEGDVSGEIQAGVSKSGVITFTVPEGKTVDPATVNEIQLHFGQIANIDAMSFSNFDKTLNMK